MNNNTTPKMRLIREVFDELHRIDPNSAITMYALRQLVRSGKIPSINIGRKILVNYNDVIDYFKAATTVVVPEETDGIRRVC
ncbi:hypothetical protein [Ructibacterium gallinarum]|uniref:Uncharacterized protein n=1 Tax=Ructibacterium gallinarum TaxID=2779355 RepID=A0A9D5LZ38_9FIRM|nr:hypothetical protein [Ructibacterium gallinarum]MBE5040696.1 hypothetical protein [Ructibacterium gallinarum]